MNETFLIWFGYGASGLIALSMAMNSIVKFRWINLVGASSFAIYGVLIHALPVALLNSLIASLDVYYLIKIYTRKELFETLEIRSDNRYLLRFLEFHQKEIEKFFPDFIYVPKPDHISFFILRNMNIAGVFIAEKRANRELYVLLDFVVPQYRDFKNGHYIYHRLKSRFVALGIHKVIMYSTSKQHSRYLKKMGFKKEGNDRYVKSIVNQDKTRDNWS